MGQRDEASRLAWRVGFALFGFLIAGLAAGVIVSIPVTAHMPPNAADVWAAVITVAGGVAGAVGAVLSFIWLQR
jgi:hypothetical protein